MNQTILLNGETRVFPILGHPIAQVKAPAALSKMMAAIGFNGIVVPIHILPADLPGWLAQARGMRNVSGIIATVPHKAYCLDFCDRLSRRAKLAGAVNIMIRENDHWIGDATDGYGYAQGIMAEGFDLAGRSALLIGAGGAGSAIAFELLDRGIADLALHDIDTVRRDAVCGRLNEAFPGKARAGTSDPRGFELIANATPLGMKDGDPMPIAIEHLSKDQFVADVVTQPAVPRMIGCAQSLGCRTMSGSKMFDAQAALLVELLTGARKIVAP